jgi:hypothetical protein
MATKAENLSRPESCLNRAADDEPIFVLRAHDPLAADTVRRWSFARALADGFNDPAAAGALDVADAMDKWRKIHG